MAAATVYTTRSGRSVRPPERLSLEDIQPLTPTSKDENPMSSDSNTKQQQQEPPIPTISTIRPFNSEPRKRWRSLSDKVLSDDEDNVDIGQTLLYRRLNRFRGRRRPARRSNAADNALDKWLIPAEHPFKILWDILTVIISFANVYATHMAIRDRQFGHNTFIRFCECWFVMDILLNFVTVYKTNGLVLTTVQGVCARYLTSWFVVDVLSLIPGEALYLKPIVERQNRRHWLKKSFFRTKAVIRVTRVLRGRHFRLFGKVSRTTRHAGVGAARLLRMIIKYAPKYVLFLRNMKGVIAIRVLRQVHWLRKVWMNSIRRRREEKDDDDTKSMTDYWEDDDDKVDDKLDDDHSQQRPVQLLYDDDWDFVDDFDDGDPY